MFIVFLLKLFFHIADSEDDQYEFAMSAFAKIYTESFKYLEKRIGEAKEQETKEELERYFLFLEDVIDQVLPSALHAFLATDFMPGLRKKSFELFLNYFFFIL